MYNRTENYYAMWKADKDNVIRTMYRNMTDDLNAGYDPMGDTITRELAEIEAYKASYKAQGYILCDMALNDGHEAVNRWCYKDMIRRGVIA